MKQKHFCQITEFMCKKRKKNLFFLSVVTHKFMFCKVGMGY